ncbi:hypothetical protein Vau01_002960 [Virgisporangium aurantiacum]|uniref:NACHT N-terminal Helical domain-containing protein n=2 Tax=Virgisporangium aurantiacum TaxID=175570 RepID=A0A8J4DVU2_9ACTN|nr:hypothetical protein Vau01_002960 [Virgisporangium aurantiacum]
MATGGLSDTVLGVFNAQGRILRLGRGLAAGLRDRLTGAGRVARSQRLEAAHAVIVVAAYFEALGEVDLPFRVDDLNLTAADQLRLSGDDGAARDLLETLLDAALPCPAPHMSSERLADQLRQWYLELSVRVVTFVEGLAVWDGLTEADRRRASRALREEVPPQALVRYQELFAQLSQEIPEFALWTGQLDHQATREQVRYALSEVRSLLRSMSSATAPSAAARALSSTYRAMLDRPILSDGDAPGVVLPTLGAGYVDPDFRVRSVRSGARPADEEWWVQARVRSDLSVYLAGAMTAPASWAAPIVVLGQPGAGKSVLTKMLAAQLPDTDFLVVRVILREVPADADLQDQLEAAVRAATGERTSWPDLARAAAGAQLVVLLDGFDELLQATGVSHSDYLVRIAAFQQREADLGRPVAVVVTSRIAVADRTRYPSGSVALRLEPFRADQVAEWVQRWNRHNESQLRDRGLEPFPADIAQRYPGLASQPLLLLMLALYDAEANGLHRGSAVGAVPLDESALYERLLTAFAAREVAKTVPEPTGPLVEAELQHLSLVAYAMVNRRRQWVTEAELDADLRALLGESRSTGRTDFRTPITRAGRALGRFFFIQRAQAVRDGIPLQTFEFLHATFTEYLVARLAVRLAAGLSRQGSALVVGPTHVDDDQMFALLSFAPLSSRQQLRFVRGCAARMIDADERQRLAGVLLDLFGASQFRAEHRLAAYEPVARPVFVRHGMYSLNLLLLLLALRPVVHAGDLFRTDADPGDAWARTVLLWRSAIEEQDWSDLAQALVFGYAWNGARRDLELRLASEPPEPAPPVDLHWHYGVPPGDPRRGNSLWSREFVPAIAAIQSASNGSAAAAAKHAIEPMIDRFAPALMLFSSHGDRATSVAHDLLDVWLAGALDAGDLDARYARLATHLSAASGDAIRPVLLVALSQLRHDIDRLTGSAELVLDRVLNSRASRDPEIATALAECVLVGLSAGRHGRFDPVAREVIRNAFLNCAPSDRLRVWTRLHESGRPPELILQNPLAALVRILHDGRVPSEDAQRARDLAATRYPGEPLPQH